MRRRLHPPVRPAEAVIFWSVVLSGCVVLFVGAFFVGKYWIGGLMARGPMSAEPKIVVKTKAEKAEAETEEATKHVQPPPEAVVKMKERAPTEAEKSEIEQMYPQDAAQMHQAGQTEKTDESVGPDEKPIAEDTEKQPPEEAKAVEGRYHVIAGAFRSEANAQRELKALQDAGYPARLTKIEREGKTMYRVIAGSYNNRAEAEKIQKQLQNEGKSALISTR